jgi:hypothetical protein
MSRVVANVSLSQHSNTHLQLSFEMLLLYQNLRRGPAESEHFSGEFFIATPSALRKSHLRCAAGRNFASIAIDEMDLLLRYRVFLQQDMEVGWNDSTITLVNSRNNETSDFKRTHAHS